MLGEREARETLSLALLLSCGPPVYCTTVSPGTELAKAELQREKVVTGTIRRWGPGLAASVTRWDRREETVGDFNFNICDQHDSLTLTLHTSHGKTFSFYGKIMH